MGERVVKEVKEAKKVYKGRKKGNGDGRGEVAREVGEVKEGRVIWVIVGREERLARVVKEGEQSDTHLRHVVSHVHHRVLQQRAGHHGVGQPLHARLTQPRERRVWRQREGPGRHHGRRGALRGRGAAWISRQSTPHQTA